MWPIIVAGTVMLVRLGLMWIRPLGVSVDQAISFAGWSEIQVRILGWVAMLAVVVLLAKKTRSGWAAVVAAANPWLNTLSLWHVWEVLALAAATWAWVSKKRWQGVMATGILITALAGDQTYLAKISTDNMFSKLNWRELGRQVDEIQKTNFLATGKTYILPAVVRKVLYNKPALALNIVWQRSVALVDFEQWTAPLAAWTVTGLSGLPPKGLLPLIYYWDIPLLIYTIVRLNKRGVGWWIAAGGLGGILFDKKFFMLGGMFLIPAVVVLLARAVERLDKRLVVAVYLVGAGLFSREMFFNQLKWQYSDVYLYRQAAMWLKDNLAAGEQAVVTNRFGPMDKMLEFYGVLPNSRIQVGEFSPTPGKVYIGLPKEMRGIPGEKIVKRIEADDELVYGYGQGLWIARY